MKFQSKLDFSENIGAWRDYYQKSPHTNYDSLNQTEKIWLMKFNEFLRQLEEKYSSILKAKFSELQARIEDQSDWLMDFNLEFAITFYLREDDPEYDEGEDNILMQIENTYLHSDHDFGFGITHINYGPNECFSGEHHCYTYHELYDHYGLDWHDLFRIGDLYFEIKIDEQSGFLPIRNLLPQLIEYLDKIAREKRRDVLMLSFIDTSLDIDDLLIFDYEQYKPYVEVIKRLDENHIN